MQDFEKLGNVVSKFEYLKEVLRELGVDLHEDPVKTGVIDGEWFSISHSSIKRSKWNISLFLAYWPENQLWDCGFEVCCELESAPRQDSLGVHLEITDAGWKFKSAINDLGPIPKKLLPFHHQKALSEKQAMEVVKRFAKFYLSRRDRGTKVNSKKKGRPRRS